MVILISMYMRRYIVTETTKLQLCIRQAASTHTDVRVRFAPSPTGDLHIGGARTALYNYLYAKAYGGKFILRIEDTNKLKNIPNVDIKIEKELYWLKIPPDESPLLGGNYGPYKQSERMDLYSKYANILIGNGTAYKCFCTNERIEEVKNGRILYDNHCRSLSHDEVKFNEDNGMPFCVRFKAEKISFEFEDLIYGKRKVLSAEQFDPIIMKSSGYPTFYLASVVDDHLMKISHIFRGIEWIASANLILSLYRAFDWPAPTFGHLPQLLNSDRSKISKRQGAPGIERLRQDGFSPEVILNSAISTGAGFEKDDDMDILSIPDMTTKFSIEKLSNYSAPLDLTRMKNFGQLELQRKLCSEEEEEILIKELRDIVSSVYNKRLSVDLNDRYLSRILNWGKVRVNNLTELTFSDFAYLWTDNIQIHNELLKDLDTELTGRYSGNYHKVNGNNRLLQWKLP